MVFRAQPAPKNVKLLKEYIEQQLREVSSGLDLIDNLTLVELHAEPTKPRTGMVVLADGTDWNPGSGAGFYGYRGAAWVLLG